MKVNFRKHINGPQSCLQYVVLGGLGRTKDIEKIAADPNYVKDGELDIRFTVNGIELDIEKVCEEWESQVDGMLKKEAEKMVADKLAELDTVFDSIKGAVEEKLGIKVKPEWEY
jgi:hypothetical protein